MNRILKSIDNAEKECGILLLNQNPDADGIVGKRVLPQNWVSRKPSDIKSVTDELINDEEDSTAERGNKGFLAHIDRLESYLNKPENINLGKQPSDLLDTLVNMVLGSPAICIYRSNGNDERRATELSKIFVNNFNLTESTAIVDLAYGRCKDDNSHWQNVLKYCKDGCFQAMFEAAKAEKQNTQSELVPYWCFGKNQKVKIERIVPMYPISKDEVNYERLIQILSLYRLTLGQARQE